MGPEDLGQITRTKDVTGWDRETQEGKGPDLVGALLLLGVIPVSGLIRARLSTDRSR